MNIKKRWFNKKCDTALKLMRNMSNIKHRNPTDQSIMDAYYQSTKNFKDICKQLKNIFWNKKIQDLEENCMNNPNTNSFWDIWKDFREDVTNQDLPLKDGNIWENYYKNLFSNKTNEHQGLRDDEILQNYVGQKQLEIPKQINKNLNRKISHHELKSVIKRLKLGKAVGIDVISNEMLKVGFPYLKECQLKLFNLIAEANIVPSDWCMSLISPIFKLDDKLNPDNYRGICVISCLSKLFLLILNDRLSYFLNTHDIISISQIGFQKNSRSTDHIFTLKTIMNKHVHHTPKGKIYACFVDLVDLVEERL